MQKNGNEAVLVEAPGSFGGLLQSSYNEFGCFDYGTYIAGKAGVDELDHFLFSDLNKDNSYQFNIGKNGNYYNGKPSDI